MALPITWPTQHDWVKRFSAGVLAAEAADLSPELGLAIGAIGSMLESKLGKALTAELSAKAADAAAELVTGLLSGEIAMGKAIISQLGTAAAALGTMLPLFSHAWGEGQRILAERDAQIRSALKARTEAAAQRCRVYYLQPAGTGSGGSVTPADLFRPVWEALQGPSKAEFLDPYKREGPSVAVYPRPLCVASLICALCGDLNPLGWSTYYLRTWNPPTLGTGGGGATETIAALYGGPGGYEAWIASERGSRALPGLGLELADRQRLATLIAGILGAVRPATLDVIERVGDQGRTLFPAVCDLLLRAYREGRWDLRFLGDLQECQIGCFLLLDLNTGNRFGPVVDLGPSLFELVKNWKYTVESASALPAVERAVRYAAFTRGADPLKLDRAIQPRFKGAARRRAPTRARLGLALGAAGLAAAGLAAVSKRSRARV